MMDQRVDDQNRDLVRRRGNEQRKDHRAPEAANAGTAQAASSRTVRKTVIILFISSDTSVISGLTLLILKNAKRDAEQLTGICRFTDPAEALFLRRSSLPYHKSPLCDTKTARAYWLLLLISGYYSRRDP